MLWIQHADVRTMRPAEKQRLTKQDEQERYDSADDGHITDGDVPIVLVEHIPVS